MVSIFSRSGRPALFVGSNVQFFSTSFGCAKRTAESNPAKHTSNHLGLFYTIPEEHRKKLFAFGGFPKSFEANVNTFQETCLMVRDPAVKIIDCLNKTNFKNPVIRYLLYGKQGTGKSLTLAHTLHYAYQNEFVILHVPWVWNWFRNIRSEVTYTEDKSGMVDLPLHSAAWLKHFFCQNEDLLNKFDLKIKNEYVWNQREKTEEGSTLKELVMHGINRVKYAGSCVKALIFELKEACRANECKVFVAVDGFNSLFGAETNLKTEDKTKVTPQMVTLTHAFLEATKQDWVNGAVVLTVDQVSGKHQSLESHFPIYLLGRKGFEHIDPFICLKVPELSDLELNSMLDYYEDRKWIQRKGGREELSFLSNRNPYELMNICASL